MVSKAIICGDSFQRLSSKGKSDGRRVSANAATPQTKRAAQPRTWLGKAPGGKVRRERGKAFALTFGSATCGGGLQDLLGRSRPDLG
eukprot:scaffold3974_cov231-Pinguiococcus_pyrenoidosus.AAC.2